MKYKIGFFSSLFGFVLLVSALASGCDARSVPFMTASPIPAGKATASASRNWISEKPSAASTLLSTKLIPPTSTRPAPTLSAGERSQFFVAFYYTTEENWRRLYPVYARLESAGYLTYKIQNDMEWTFIGYGDPSCLPAIDDIQSLASDLVDWSRVERKQFGTDDLAYGRKEIAIQISDESLFLQPLPTPEGPFALYLAPALPNFAVARLGKGALDGAAVSPSGDQLAVATPIGVYMYRMSEGNLLREEWFVPTAIPMTAVAFAPDGKTLACGSNNDLLWLADPQPESTVVMLLDPATGTPQRFFAVGPRGYRITHLAFSPDGGMLAAGYAFWQQWGLVNSGVVLLDLQSGEVTDLNLDAYLKGDSCLINSLAYSPDGAVVAVGSAVCQNENPKTVLFLDPRTREWTPALPGYAREARSVVFSPDGGALATLDERGTVDVWDTNRWDKIWTYTIHDGKEDDSASVSCPSTNSARLVFSLDGGMLVAGAGDGVLHILDGASGKEMRSLQGHTQGILAMGYSSDGRLLTSVSSDRSVLQHAATGEKTLRQFALDGHRRISDLEFSPDHETLAEAEECGGGAVWDIAGRRLLWSFDGGPFDFSPDGKILAASGEGHSLVLWDTDTRSRRKVLTGHTDAVNSIAFSPDGKFLASGGADKSLILWDTSTGQKRWTLGNLEYAVKSVAFSPDGVLLAYTFDAYASDIHFLDPAAGKSRGSIGERSSAGPRIVFSPDGKFLAAFAFFYVRVFDFPSDETPTYVDGGRAAAFSPDGKIGASGSPDIYSTYAYVWDSASGELRMTLKGHNGFVIDVAFSPDGNTIASASLDGTILLWDLKAALGR